MYKNTWCCAFCTSPNCYFPCCFFRPQLNWPFLSKRENIDFKDIFTLCRYKWSRQFQLKNCFQISYSLFNIFCYIVLAVCALFKHNNFNYNLLDDTVVAVLCMDTANTKFLLTALIFFRKTHTNCTIEIGNMAGHEEATDGLIHTDMENNESVV